MTPPQPPFLPPPARVFRPRRYKPGNVGSWSGHLSFARDLVDTLRPRLLVELGTHLGESYFGFCQAVEESGVTCACYAVDTWQGDAQAGAYDESVFRDVTAYNEAHYARFSRLLRATFDDALPQFADDSIDLLHVDGLHTYDAVRHDFETWLPKVRPGGVVLLHDTAARHDDFGVWRLWRELESRFPTFEFTHSWGLGVLRKTGGTEVPFVDGLLAASPTHRDFIRHYYATAAELVARIDVEERDAPVRLQVYPSLAGGYGEATSRVVHAKAGEWTAATFSLPDGSPGGPLRFDPASEPCLVRVKEVRFRHHRDGTVLEQWTTPKEIALTPQFDAWRLPGAGEVVTFLCTGGDPQLACPVPEGGLAPVLVDIWLRVDRDIATVLAAVRDALMAEALPRPGTAAGDLAAAHASRSDLDRRLTDRTAQVERLEEEIRLRHATSEGLLAEIAERDRELDAVRREAEEQLRSASVAATELARASDREQRLEAALHDRAAAVVALEAQASQHAQALARVTQDAATYVDRLARRDEFVRTLQHQLSDRERAAAGLLQKLRETQARAAALEGELQARRAAPDVSGDAAPRHGDRSWAAVRRALPRGGVAGRSLDLAARAHVRWRLRGQPVAELRDSGLFDAQFYLATYRDVAEGDIDPLTHYVLAGAEEGRQPNHLFDPSFYAAQSPDVAPRGLDAIMHYVRHGAAEGRPPHPLFDAHFYVARRPGLTLASALAGWLEDRGRSAPPHPLVDPVTYAASYPDVGDPARAVDHYLRHGARERRTIHPLFDPVFYLSRYADVERAGLDPLVHYLVAGAAEGRQPHPLFDPAFYLWRYPDVARAGINPLVHYVVAGGAERRDPHPWFDTNAYLEQCPEAAGHAAGPLGHYVLEGAARGLAPHPDFDAAAYLADNGDVREAGVNPLVHYVTIGAAEGRVARPVAPRPPAAEPHAPTAPTPLPRLQVNIGLRLEGPASPSADGDRRTVVCVSHVYPWPAGAGNEYRIARMLASLRRTGVRVILVVSPIDETDPSGPRFDATAGEVDVLISCTADGRVRVVGECGGALRSLHGRPAPDYAAVLGEAAQEGDERSAKLLGIERTFCHDALVSVVQHVEASFAPCVLLAEYVWMTRLLPLCRPETPRVIDTIDVWSTKAEKVLQYGVQDIALTPAEERARLLRGDLVLAIQEAERQVLSDLVPEREVIAAGVDATLPDRFTAPEGHRVILVASDNQMNRAGLRDFLRFAWPVVRREVPAAELEVVGRIGAAVPPAADGVIVAGWVETVREHYERARLAINPAIAGTGLKIKTVEALAHYRPVVSWPNGLDGLGPAARACCLSAEDWYDFALKVIAALSEPPEARFSDTDRAALAAEFSEERAYRALHAWLDRAWNRTAATRRPGA